MVTFTIGADISPVCIIFSTALSSESDQVDEVGKLAKSGLFGASVYTKSLSWHNFAQNIASAFPNCSPPDFHIYDTYMMSLFLGSERECCFVFVAEFQNFMTRRTFRLSAMLLSV